MRATAVLAARVLARLAAAAGLLALLTAPPILLVLIAGWPLPHSVPTTTDAWGRLLTQPLSDTAILRMVVVFGWLVWAAFTKEVIAGLLDAWRGRSRPVPRLREHPVRAVAALLVASLAVGTASAGGGVAGPVATLIPDQPPPTTTSVGLRAFDDSQARPAAKPVLLPTGPGALRLADGCAYLYTVVPGDTLWDIAERCLGDPTRWPEIWQLNQDRFWPAVSGYTRLHDPDLIYPRWTLTLPDGATSPDGAPPAQPVDPPEPQPRPTPEATDPPTTPPHPSTQPTPSATPTASVQPTPSAAASSGPAATGDPDGVVPVPVPTPTPTPTQAPVPAGTADPAGGNDAESPGVRVDDHGARLHDGSWLPWTLVVAVIAALAVMGVQRRRRGRHGFPDASVGDTLPPEPPTAVAVRQAWREVPPRASASVFVPPGPERPAPGVQIPRVPPPAPLPRAGLGLTGPGAHSAARGALVTALSSGGPDDGDAQCTVVVPAGTLAALLGADAVPDGDWPRLVVTPDLDAALTVVEQRLLRARRLRDEADLAAAVAPRSPRGPSPSAPVLLLCDPPDGAALHRTRAVVGLGVGVAITVVLLGTWAHGPTVTVEADGTCHPTGPGGPGGGPDQLAVLTRPAAVELLRVLYEAHTGQPTGADPARPAADEPAHDVHADDDGQAHDVHADDDGQAHDDAPAQDEGQPQDVKRAAAARTGRPDQARHARDERPDDDSRMDDDRRTDDDPDDDDDRAGADPGGEGLHNEEKAGPARPAGIEDDPDDGAAATEGPAEPIVDHDRHDHHDHPEAGDMAEVVGIVAQVEQAPADGAPGGPAGEDRPVRVAVGVLGGLVLPWHPGLQKRGYCEELVAYLAVRTGGATPDQIMEDLWPEDRREPASSKLHATTSNLGRALATPAGAGLVKVDGRWRLNPSVVDVDLWQLRQAHAASRTTTDPGRRLEALRRVCDLYTGPLGGQKTYEWLGPHRTGVRAMVVEAYRTLAATVAATDPGEAGRLLLAAADRDPTNEELAQELLRTYHRLGDATTMQAILRQLTGHLTESGLQVSAATRQLHDELLADLHHHVGA